RAFVWAEADVAPPMQRFVEAVRARARGCHGEVPQARDPGEVGADLVARGGAIGEHVAHGVPQRLPVVQGELPLLLITPRLPDACGRATSEQRGRGRVREHVGTAPERVAADQVAGVQRPIESVLFRYRLPDADGEV